MMIVNTGWFFYLESFLLISGISGFSFFTTEHIRKLGIYRKFHSYSFLKWDFSQTKSVNVSFSLVKCFGYFYEILYFRDFRRFWRFQGIDLAI